MIGRLAVAAAMVFATPLAVDAGTIKLRDLLTQGYAIVGTAVAPGSVTSASLNTPNQPDELVITLQRAGDIAFCHFIFGATYSNETIPDAGCFQPGSVSPPPGSPPSAGGPAPSPELAPSAASSN